MNASAETAIAALNLHFLLDYPREAARRIEAMPADEVGALLADQPVHAVVPVWQSLATDVEQAVFAELPEARAVALLAELEPARSAALLSRLEEDERERFMRLLNAQVSGEIQALMAYPADSAGQLMDPRVLAFRGDLTAQEALARLRQTKRRGLRELYLVDDDGPPRRARTSRTWRSPSRTRRSRASRARSPTPCRTRRRARTWWRRCSRTQ
ncbi:MAG: hypothetical protein M5R42_17880 [Rhodocyclaceae bacterium]|nr:hypothetical protein [Rhodocyclaceae bacterium]